MLFKIKSVTFLFIGLVLFACNRNADISDAEINHLISYENLSYSDTIHISRNSIEENINLVFPAGGQNAGLFLYSGSAYDKLKAMPEPNDNIIKPLKTDFVAALERLPQINIKGLEDGTYYMLLNGKLYPRERWVVIRSDNDH